MARNHHQQDFVKRYLLQQLTDAERQQIELQLLGDDDFFKEVEIVEDELIDEYLANELSRDERSAFEEHFLSTPERNSKLRSAEALKRYLLSAAPDQPHKTSRFAQFLQKLGGPFFLSPARVPVALVAMIVVGLGVWRVAFYQSDLEKGLIALNSAYRQERPIEARISALDYARFIDRRGKEPEVVNNPELDRAQRLLLDAQKDDPGSASSHALGKLYLLQREIDKAIEYLEKAKASDSKNAQINADLGAAYFEKGKLELAAGKSDPNSPQAGKGLEYLGRSVEFLKEALELDPNLLEALFNLALVQENQGLYHEAQVTWRAYLEKDSSSQWAVEARENLKQLEEKTRTSENAAPVDAFMIAYRARDDTTAWEIYRRNHGNGGNKVTNDLVKGLADSSAAKSTEILQALDYLGQLEISNANDAYTAALAKFYASATPQTRSLLIQARQQIVKGYESAGRSEYAKATELFSSARTTFEKVGSLPETLAADVALAHTAAVQPDLIKGQELAERLIPACESQGYQWLLARGLTVRAHNQSNLNNYTEAISDGHRAMQIFQRLQDPVSKINSLVQLASLHLFLNDIEMSFSFLGRARAMVEEEKAPAVLLWGIHIAASLNLSALKLYRAALDYQHEALQLVLPTHRPLYISRSHQFLSRTYGSLRQFDLALQNVHKAYELGQPLAAEYIGQNIMAAASLARGDLYRLSGDPQRALVAYDESSELYQKIDFAHYNYLAHKGKLLSYLAQNNDALAGEELQIVLELFDTYREKILDERQRISFFDKEQDTYDLAIDFAYSRRGDEYRAFDYSEISRARNLHELMQHGAKVGLTASGADLRSSKLAGSASALPLTTTEIEKQMPEEVQLVQYAVLEKKLLIWRVTPSSKLVTKAVDIEKSALEGMVTKTLNQIGRRDENAVAGLQNLYAVLIDPIRAELDPEKVICFVPDKRLHFVPFSALRSASSGRYLIEDFRLMIVPSATILIEATNKARARASIQEEELLAVGNPTFDRATNPTLANLSDAEREVEQIARHYNSRPVRLIRSDATRKSVSAALPKAQVAHLAAHYQIDSRSRLSSKLVLAPDPGERAHAEQAGLNSGDIYEMKLVRTKLVVLSACQTGIEQQLSGEGPIGFARSFLVADVPVVVASLWPVDSTPTADLMISFHRHRKQNRLSTADALRRVQRDMMNHEHYRHPYFWAAFTIIGGYSSY